jgi:hypothetical protein
MASDSRRATLVAEITELQIKDLRQFMNPHG